VYLRVEYENDRMEKTLISSVLSQTRGCGKPPQIVENESLIKFIKTVSLKA